MANSISSSEAAISLNALSHYCAEDQQALLEVIGDYFDSDKTNSEYDSSMNINTFF